METLVLLFRGEALRTLREPDRRLQGGITYVPTPDDISGWLRLAIAHELNDGASRDHLRCAVRKRERLGLLSKQPLEQS